MLRISQQRKGLHLDAHGNAGANIRMILISQVPWGSPAFEVDTQRCQRPHQLYFPAYKMQELLQVGPEERCVSYGSNFACISSNQ
jgi:hypothetical protein